MKFPWIHEHREFWTLKDLCRMLRVARSGYYAWRRRRQDPGAREVRRRRLLDEIRAAHEGGRGLYGSPRVHAVLIERGIQVCVNTVAKLMKEARIRSYIRRSFRYTTTDSRHLYRPAENLLNRQFAAALPDQKWLGDITYLPTREGTLYLASVLDVCSRRIVGWSMSTSLQTQLCLDALTMAIQRRRPEGRLLHHSDRGMQYACDAYQAMLEGHDITCSMSRVGNCYDNAMMESYHATLKNELLHLQPEGCFATLDQARRMLFDYIEVFYNRQRRHSAIGYLSPEQFEASLN
jgi:putative transposase